jgi:steroid delta-isomerase-like uncharacterized protein
MRDFVVDLLRRMEDDFSRPDAAERVASHYGETAVLKDMTMDTPLVGKNSIAEALVPLFAALTDFQYSATLVSDDGETAVVEWVTTGRHTGAFADERPTGKVVSYCGVNLLTFEASGLISEERCYWDSASLARQLAVD